MVDHANDDDNASSSRDNTVVSETAPLLPSSGSSRLEESSTTASSEIYRDVPSDLDEANQKVSRKRAVAIILSVYLLIFLQANLISASNMSGMTMAQSTIAADLEAYEEAMWFTSAYLIALSSLSPLYGRLASIFSPRTMVLVSSVFFSLGGLVTARADSFQVFILGRVISGAGAAGIMVLAFILILELTSKKQRGLFVGMVNAGFTTGVSLGAVVFGAMIPVTGWVPCGVVAGLGVYFSLPKSLTSGNGSKTGSVSSKLLKIDYLGALLLTGTIVLFLYGLSGTIQIIPIVVSAGTLVVFVLVEYFIATDPIIPITVLQNRGALLSCFAQLGFMAARWTVLFYAPITALAVFGFSPGASGSMLIPTNLGFGSGSMIIGWLHVRRAGSFYTACLMSIVLFAISLGILSFTSSPSIPTAVYILIIFVNGFCTGAALNYTLAHLLHLTLPETHYVSTSLLGTFRGFAGSFGSAIGGGIFSRTLRDSLEKGFKAADHTDNLTPARLQLIRKLIGSPALVYNGGLGGMDQQVAVQGYVDALKVLFQAAVVLAVVVLLVQAATGWKGPSDKEDPEEVRAAVAEHDGEFEA